MLPLSTGILLTLASPLIILQPFPRSLCHVLVWIAAFHSFPHQSAADPPFHSFGVLVQYFHCESPCFHVLCGLPGLIITLYSAVPMDSYFREWGVKTNSLFFQWLLDAQVRAVFLDNFSGAVMVKLDSLVSHLFFWQAFVWLSSPWFQTEENWPLLISGYHLASAFVLGLCRSTPSGSSSLRVGPGSPKISLQGQLFCLASGGFIIFTSESFASAFHSLLLL